MELVIYMDGQYNSKLKLMLAQNILQQVQSSPLTLNNIVPDFEAPLYGLNLEHLSVEKGRRKRGGKKNKTQVDWSEVKKHCRFEGDLTPQCINAYYEAIGSDNGLEWWITLMTWVWSVWWVCWTGIFMWFLAPIFGVILWVVPDAKPDIDQAPWKDVDWFTGGWYYFIAQFAKVGEPYAFVLTQMITWGQSDLDEFQLIYMSGPEACAYMFFIFAIIPILLPGAITWVVLTWWAYLILLIYDIFLVILGEGDEDNKK